MEVVEGLGVPGVGEGMPRWLKWRSKRWKVAPRLADCGTRSQTAPSGRRCQKCTSNMAEWREKKRILPVCASTIF